MTADISINEDGCVMGTGSVGDAETLLELSDVVQHVYFWLVTVGLGVCVAAHRIWIHVRAPSSVESFLTEAYGTSDQLDLRIVKSLTCVIVDDKPEDFPIEFLRGFFKEVVVMTSVSLNDAQAIAKYDVIFLDVAGVVQEDMERGGAILIERLRRIRRDGIIVSVSHKKYDVEVTAYFANADVRIRKPIQAATCQEQIMAHLRNAAGPYALASAIDEAVSSRLGARPLRKVAGDVKKFVKSRSASAVLESDVARRAGVGAELASLGRQLKGMAA